jgi:hypothetical protein
MSRLNQRVLRRLGAVFVLAMALVWTFALSANDKPQAGSASDGGKSATTTKNENADKPPAGGFGGPGFNGGAFGGGSAAGGGAFGGSSAAGGGGSGGGSAPFFAAKGNWIQSEEVVVGLSKSGKTLYGYSARTGSWDRARLDQAVKDFEPVVDGNQGVVVVGKRVYAFSGIVGRWDSVDVADAKEPPVPMVGSNNLVRFDIGSKIYMFSAITGRWSVADLSVDAD